MAGSFVYKEEVRRQNRWHLKIPSVRKYHLGFALTTSREVDNRSTYLNRMKKGEILQMLPSALLNPYNLYSLLTVSQLDFIKWLQRNGLLSFLPKCGKCRKVSMNRYKKIFNSLIKNLYQIKKMCEW